MSIQALSYVVESFARDHQAMPDADLEIPWVWQDYDEGVRFAFFRILEELHTLAARLESLRLRQGNPTSTAQKIMAQHHLAFRDLEAILLGVDDALAEMATREDEWPIKETLRHIVQAEIGFLLINRYTIERERSSEELPMEMPEGDFYQAIGKEPARQEVKSGTYSSLLSAFRDLESRVAETFATVTDSELPLPAVYWENEPYPLEFRLHRFESHLRQHSIQIEKTLAALERPVTETRRLLRMIYNALGEVEGVLIGAHAIGEKELEAATELVELYADEIEKSRHI